MTNSKINRVKEENRTIYFDILNILSCFAVVVLHMNAISWNYENTGIWREALCAEVLFYFAVPIFFMLTGATLLDYRERYSTATFLKRRVAKIVLPYFVWSAFYFGMSILRGTGSLDVKAVVEAFTAYQAQPVFWFLQAVFNIYLCMPLLSLIAGKKHEKLRWYLIAVGVASRVLIPMITQFWGVSFGSHAGLYIMDGMLLYVLLGYQLANSSIPSVAQAAAVSAGVLALIIRYVGTVKLSVQAGILDTSFYGYVSVWAMCPAIGLFILAKRIPGERIGTRTKRTLSTLSSFSFGVYLIHLFMIAVFAKVTRLANDSLIYRLCGPIIVYAASCITVSMIKRIPIIRRIVP